MSILSIHQRLETSGARTALPFRRGNDIWLGVAQLAEDIEGTPPHMNGGNNDVDALLFRWNDGRFELQARIPAHGGEDIEVFQIGHAVFLALANLRSGSGPYEPNVASVIYRWRAGGWEVFQTIDTFAAKQWRHFTFDGRHFLALAQGLTLPHLTAVNPAQSCILEWDGAHFVPFQVLDGMWGYNFTHFTVDGAHYLAYADHTSESLVYRWDGRAFVRFQSLSDKGGRAFSHFRWDGTDYLAFARIDGESMLYRWNGGEFVPYQTLGGPAGREFCVFESGGDLYLVRICFIEGTPADPKSDLQSELYRWKGDRFVLAETFPTFGGTDAHVFEENGSKYLVVSNSLTADIRFRTDTIVYRLGV